jgi:hypothetical protein
MAMLDARSTCIHNLNRRWPETPCVLVGDRGGTTAQQSNLRPGMDQIREVGTDGELLEVLDVGS